MIYNLDAEMFLIGAILRNNEIAHEIDLGKYEFYDPLHGEVYAKAISDINSGHRADPVTISPFFDLEPLGGDYLYRLAEGCPSLSAARDYARAIREAFQKREVQRVATNLLEDRGDPEGAVSRAQEELGQIFLGSLKNITIAEAMVECIKSSELAAEGKYVQVMTGFPLLDLHLGGLRGSRLVVVAARPGVGKSSLALQIGMNVAKTGKVLMFSLEMSATELAERELAAELEVDSRAIALGKMQLAGYDAAWGKAREAENIQLLLDESSLARIERIISKSRASRKDLKLIIIDYLQIISGNNSKTRNDEVADITKSLKALAKNLNVPILLLSQLNREVEKRTEGRPMLADLRDSGSIEQDADQVVFLFRPNREDTRNVTAYVAKNRSGLTGDIPMIFDGKKTRFEEVRND